MAFDVEKAHAEFSRLKQANAARNTEYYMLRQACQGNFRWPRDWPAYMPMVKHNLCKPITERFATYLMGRGFTYNIDRPNTLEFRESAERSEKILSRLYELSSARVQFTQGARIGSQLGRTIFKVYKKGTGKRKHACFSMVQPDYFYGIPSGDNLGDWAVVYYSYPLDRTEAVRLFGDKPYKTEGDLDAMHYYDPLPEDNRGVNQQIQKRRRIPVLEAWSKDSYLLEVGGIKIYNGDNRNKWSDTKEGFIPFEVIENIRNSGDGFGESDIKQARELNEQLNYLLSRKQYIVGRWLQPTLVWEGAPQNYAEILSSTIGGGGAIPARLGSRLYFLAYDRPNPAVQEMQAELRQAILDTAGINELALQGDVQGSINTGPSLETQMLPTTQTIEKKRSEWQTGIERLSAMLLQLQEDIGDSEALGLAVINASLASEDQSDGQVVALSGKDIAGLRRVVINWPGLLPKDDLQAARFELEKAQAGIQSYYTTLEKLGADYPDDELARIRQENVDPSLRGEKVAEQMRAQAPLINAQAKAQQMQQEQGGVPALEEPTTGGEEALLRDGNIGARLRALARGRSPLIDDSGDEPIINEA